MGKGLLDSFDGAHDRAAWVGGLRTSGVFGVSSERDAEEDYGCEAFCNEGIQKGDQLLDAAAGNGGS